MTKFIFLTELLSLILPLLIFGYIIEEDPQIVDTLGIIKNISLKVEQVKAVTSKLTCMIGELNENQRFLEREIVNLKGSIMKKLDQLLNSTGSGNDPIKEHFQNIEHKFENLNAKVDVIDNIIPNLELAFKQELVIPNNISVKFSVSDILPRDCLDVFQRINSSSGVYKIYPDGNLWNSKEVLCKDGYTVILKRQETLQTHFNRTWVEYCEGFGSTDGEYYIGNNVLHLLTSRRNQKLSVIMKDEYNQQSIRNYSHFSVGNEDTNFKLSVMGFSDNEGGHKLAHCYDIEFTTLDRDNDRWSGNVAAMDESGKGGGWWYGSWNGIRGTMPDKARFEMNMDLKELTMMIKYN